MGLRYGQYREASRYAAIYGRDTSFARRELRPPGRASPAVLPRQTEPAAAMSATKSSNR